MEKVYFCELTGAHIKESCKHCTHRGKYESVCQYCSKGYKYRGRKKFDMFQLANCSQCHYNGEDPAWAKCNMCANCVNMSNFYFMGEAEDPHYD